MGRLSIFALSALLGVFHHLVALPVENSRDRAGSSSRKRAPQRPVRLLPDGDLHLRNLVEESALVRFDNRAAHNQRGVAVHAHQRGDALQLLKKEGNGAKAHHIRLKLPQNVLKAVRRPGRRARIRRCALDVGQCSARSWRPDTSDQAAEHASRTAWSYPPTCSCCCIPPAIPGRAYSVAGRHGRCCS